MLKPLWTWLSLPSVKKDWTTSEEGSLNGAIKPLTQLSNFEIKSDPLFFWYPLISLLPSLYPAWNLTSIFFSLFIRKFGKTKDWNFDSIDVNSLLLETLAACQKTTSNFFSDLENFKFSLQLKTKCHRRHLWNGFYSWPQKNKLLFDLFILAESLQKSFFNSIFYCQFRHETMPIFLWPRNSNCKM
jgi:hypothetical protein